MSSLSLNRRPLAFVLSGGGARGALQAGALRALLEAGIQPDLLVGTSIGAVNAAYLAVHGINLNTIEKLIATWHEAAAADLLPTNYLRLTMRALVNYSRRQPDPRLRDFFVSHGLSPELRFEQIQGVRLILVAADLNHNCLALYGADPQQTILEGLLASTALPPWMRPIEKDNRLLIDGGVLSMLPIQAALEQGARMIIALDLIDLRVAQVVNNELGAVLAKLVNTVERHQADLELVLARAQGVPVHHIALQGERPVMIWDFSRTAELVERGYDLARQSVGQLLASDLRG